MPRSILHPAVYILLWLMSLVLLQLLEGWSLVMAFFALPLLGRIALLRARRLVWRARWLILSLSMVFLWGVAGEPLLPGFSMPTREGLQEALIHLGRLILVLIAVAAFLELMPLPALLGGTRQLLVFLRHFGFDSDRAVVRLMLVLHYVEALPSPRNWRFLLATPSSPVQTIGSPGLVECVEVSYRSMRNIDYFVLMMACVAFLVCCFQ